MSLVYWKISNGRGTLPALVAAYAGVGMEWDEKTANTWPAPKAQSPFGQLPIYIDGDVTLSQSMAIVRYIARKNKLDGGDDLKVFGISEMLTEEYNDIVAGLGKAKYSAESEVEAEHKKFYSEGLPTQYAYLEKLCPEEGFFTGASVVLGDLAILTGIYSTIRCNEEHGNAALAASPKLAAWYKRLTGEEKVAAYLDTLKDVATYFSWTPK
jgi:glutathione S-transferase